MRIAIVYNAPCPSRYDAIGEKEAVVGVLQAVEAVNQSLLELGHDVLRIPLTPPIEQARQELVSLDVALVFNLFEGFCGYPETEAMVPEVCLEVNKPYTGCTEHALRLALDKEKTKEVLEAAGIRTPRSQLLEPQSLYKFHLNYPCIVKPCAEDASHGISEESVVNDFAALKKQVTVISSSYGNCALVEEFISGREFNATVLGNSQCVVLPISEIVYSLPPELPRILTFAAKWETDSLYYQNTKVSCPADIEDKERLDLAETTFRAFQVLECHGYARVDMRMDEQGYINVIEVNPNPDISPGTGAARQAEAAGMSYTQFIEKIVQLALERK